MSNRLTDIADSWPDADELCQRDCSSGGAHETFTGWDGSYPVFSSRKSVNYGESVRGYVDERDIKTPTRYVCPSCNMTLGGSVSAKRVVKTVCADCRKAARDGQPSHGENEAA